MTFIIGFTFILQALFTVSSSSVTSECFPPLNARLFPQRTFGLFAVVCDKGFIINGSTLISCVNGIYYTTPPTCVERSSVAELMCKDLPAPVYGKKRCDAGLTTAGKRCLFSCLDGYQLIGSSDLTCQENLEWSGTQPQCLPAVLECQIPPPLLNGTVINCSYKPKFGETCAFRCNTGFVLEGPHYLFCRQNGKLVDDEGKEKYPKCVAVVPPTASRTQAYHRNQQQDGFQERHHNQIRNSTLAFNHCGQDNGGCNQLCVLVNGVPQCRCHEGYKLFEGKTCIDINECTTEPHVCGHICRNTLGSYECSCHPGYVLKVDNKCEVSQETLDAKNNDQLGNVASKERFSFPEAPAGRTEVNLDENLNNFQQGHHKRNQNNFQQGHRRNQNALSSSNPCLYNNGGCEQICNVDQGIPKCDCKTGYRLNYNGRSCSDINECADRRLHNCAYECRNTMGSYKCLCRKGYKPTSDGECEDIDECATETLNNCHHNCENTPGSYICSCLPGYVLTSGGKCEGCRKNSYKSENDSQCVECPPNSYTKTEGKTSITDCVCYPGFLGNPEENISCEDIDECAEDNFGCSDRCVNTPGGAHCTCPLGFEVKEDKKTCDDIDECSVKNGGCQGICNNTIGNFSCSCPEGYVTSQKDRYLCDDIDECEINNGGCGQKCVNFPGGYYCGCNSGYRLDAGLKNCRVIQCPRLPVPPYSELRCKNKNATLFSAKQNRAQLLPRLESYPIGSICKVICSKGFKAAPEDKSVECLEDGTWNDVLPECKALQCPTLKTPENGDVLPRSCTKGLMSVKQKCTFTCRPGYELQGDLVVQCKNNLTWSIRNKTKCVPVKVLPFITCPDDITVVLKPQERYVNVSIPKPKTNMQNIQIYPEWVNMEQVNLFPAGKTDIIFTVVTPSANMSRNACAMSVNILDMEPPLILGCPDVIEVKEVGVYGKPVTWQEPEVYDNVGVESITKSIEPNSTLTPGVHTATYVAKDAAGNTASCSFEINVTRAICSDLKDPVNGNANCMDWMLGKLCEPFCDAGYIMNPDDSPFYMCDDSGTWNPSDVISPCLKYFPALSPQCDPGFEYRTLNETGENICLECPYGTTWSTASSQCEEN